MVDVHGEPYLRFMADLLQHTTRTLYDESRANLLELIARKISYKEHLVRQFDEQFSDALHKQIRNVEGEVNALLSFVQAFDRMAEHLADETARAVDHWYKTDRQLIITQQLLEAENERAGMWSNTAFDLHDHILNNRNPTANA